MPRSVAVIGAGPAGLIAAERLACRGVSVDVFDRMASPARKLLVAGRGGLNITHSEPLERLLGRYEPLPDALRDAILAWGPQALRDWCACLGQPTFVGSSGRVFPEAFKAAPLLRAWLRRLDKLGVRLHPRRRWTGWTTGGALRFDSPDASEHRAEATILALGGASWPRLGSDGTWVPVLSGAGVAVSPLAPSNCGIDLAWSDHLRGRFEGAALKRIALGIAGRQVRGELVLTAHGLEGGPAYALSGPLRAALAEDETALLHLDLRPDLDVSALAGRLGGERRGQSLSGFLRRQAGLAPAAVALLRESLAGAAPPGEPDRLAGLLKSLPLRATGLRPIARAISSAGGIGFGELDKRLMLRSRPGVFAAGEMLDWDAPTGGYLLQASFSTGRAAAEGVLDWLGIPDGHGSDRAVPGRDSPAA